VIDAALARLDAIAQAELVARGELSAAELFNAWRSRLDALNPLLRAVVASTEDCPRVAPGPLSGVPFLVKDSMPWPGMRWAMGSRALAHQIAPTATLPARRLMQSGLVCVGKSATSEFGLLASTETLLEGVTHNPWDLSLSAGGSSGGSAAAVAAGLVPIAHASDGGGSIRIPASFCGVFGFKPSRGRTLQATYGGSAFEDMTSEHCVTRSVRDSALFLSLVEDESYGARLGFVREAMRRSLRIATWTAGVDGADAAPAVVESLQDASALLTELGHRVEPIVAPAFDASALAQAFFAVAGSAVANIVERIDRARGTPVQQDELEPFTWGLLDAFVAAQGDPLARARATLADAARTYREKTRGYDVVLTPTVATEPWRLGYLSPIVAPDELMRRIARTNAFAPLANIVGAPAMSVPLHRNRHGVPIGAHFTAAPGADALLLGLAYQLEESRPWKDDWPPYSIPALAKQAGA
jgi:amidase